MGILTSLATCLLLAGAPAAPEKAPPPTGAPGATTTTSPALVDASGQWRGARWGMGVDAVQAHFKGEVRKVDPVLKLADSNEVPLQINGLQLVGRKVRVAFVFAQGGLTLVSIRTLEGEYAPAESFEEATKLLAAAFGSEGELTKDDNYIDLRQVTWLRPQGAVDLKYIPGVMVLMYRPLPAAEPPPLLKRP